MTLVLSAASDDARGVGGPGDVFRLRRALVVVLFECVRTERVERVGGRILVNVSTRYLTGVVSREVVCKLRG
jgi:hypothetical protein